MLTDKELTLEEAMTLGLMKKRRNDLVVFVGRNAGQLHDNAKHLFIHAANNSYGFEPVFFTMHSKDQKTLQDAGLPACTLDGRGVKMLTTAGMLVIDDLPMSWLQGYMLASGAKKLQLFHGIAFKKIGFPEIESTVNMNPEKADALRFGYSACETVLSTSPWVTKTLMSQVFKADSFLDYGYPRNDIFFRPLSRHDFLNVDMETYRLLLQEKKNGASIVFYMPTFRDTGLNLIDEQNNFVLDPTALARYAEEHNTKFVLKLHPYVNDSMLASIPGIIRYPSKADIYPLLPLGDALITDYSSVYFDFLLLKKPVLFFPYDLERYCRQDREMFFDDFESMAPGPIAHTQEKLLANLTEILRPGHDAYVSQREQMAKMFFAHQDGASCDRICKYIADTLQQA